MKDALEQVEASPLVFGARSPGRHSLRLDSAAHPLSLSILWREATSGPLPKSCCPRRVFRELIRSVERCF